MKLYVCLSQVLKVAHTGKYGECKDGKSEDEACISLEENKQTKTKLVTPSTANKV